MDNKMPIKLAKDIVEKYKLRQAVVLCNDMENYNHIVTYGCDKENCMQAGLAGDFWKDVMQWPKEKRSKYSADLQNRIEQLEAENAELREYTAFIKDDGCFDMKSFQIAKLTRDCAVKNEQLTQAQAYIKVLKEALIFYREKWVNNKGRTFPADRLLKDKGQMAKQAIQQTENAA